MKVTDVEVDGETVVRIDVDPSPRPAFAKKDGKEVLMVRSDNATVEFSGQALLDYQHSRWPA